MTLGIIIALVFIGVIVLFFLATRKKSLQPPSAPAKPAQSPAPKPPSQPPAPPYQPPRPPQVPPQGPAM